MEKLLPLLKKYKAGNITPAEKRQLLKELAVNDEQLKKVLQEEFFQNVATGKLFMDAETSDKILQRIKHRIKNSEEKRPATKYRYRVWLAAACVAGIILLGAQWFLKNQQAAVKPVAQATEKLYDTIINTKAVPLQKKLGDGTTVMLQQGSSLIVPNRMDTAMRQIKLKGIASFAVAKNAQRPFTVTANNIVTTALGTSFSITAHHGSNIVIVHLFEGKVKVSAENNTNNRFKTVYLQPGEQCTVNTQNFSSHITTVRQPDEPVLVKKDKSRPLLLAKNINYHQTVLAQVFEDIKNMQQMSIQYNRQELDSLRFTGSFKAGEPVGSVLENIAMLNNLTLIKTDKGFRIKK